MVEKTRLKLEIEYNGKNFNGWQIQPKEKTIQGEVEKAFAIIFQIEIRVHGSSRTDSGVHARRQVAHVDIPRESNLRQLKNSLNALLCDEIVICCVKKVSQNFNSRFDAISRQYKYYISEENIAISKDFVHVINRSVKLERLNLYAQYLIGEHDFTSFSKVNSGPKNYQSMVYKSRWYRKNKLIIFEIEAIRFLRGMVRAIVGNSLYFEKNERDEKDFYQILLTRDRSLVKFHAPACGLLLEKVNYRL